MPFHLLLEDELRSICKKKVESLEYWLRRIIHEKFSNQFGANYFQLKLENNESVIKGEITKKAQGRMAEQPERYSREIDATLLDDLIAILCNQKNYIPLFQDAFQQVAPIGNEQLRHILNKIWESRNPLSHANPISIRQAEQLLCYSNDIIDSLKKYYIEQGESNLYNVPTILKMVDSFGNTIYREQMTKRGDDTVIVMLSNNPECFLRPSDIYSIELEIDPSFDPSTYTLNWKVNDTRIAETSNKLVLDIEVKHIRTIFMIKCFVTSNRDWHKCGDHDDSFTIMLKVLPPVE